MTPKRIIFAIMCTLLVIVIVLSGIVINKVVGLLQTQEPTVQTTEPIQSTTDTTPQTTPSTTTPSVPVTTAPTEPEDPSHVHEFVFSETVAATCDTYGYTIYVCSCGRQDIPLDEQVEPYGHSYGIGETITPTCTEYGCTQYVCSRCGNVDEQNIVDAYGHQFQFVESVIGDCETDQYDLYRCSICSEEEKQNLITATGHDYVLVLTQELSCTQDSKNVYQCTICEGMLEEILMAAGGHCYGSWTAQEDGTWQRTCTSCAHTSSSADLYITQSQLSDLLTDQSGIMYKLHTIYVGTAEEPMMFQYTIYDYQYNGTVYYSYYSTQGLVITYTDPSGTVTKETLPILQSASFTIAAG